MVLDLNMPDIGGFEVIEFVRGQDRLRQLPILVVTTRGDEELPGHGRWRWARQGFMTKPFAPQAILAEVGALLAGKAGVVSDQPDAPGWWRRPRTSSCTASWSRRTSTSAGPARTCWRWRPI